jgi:hypothetical protein
MELASSILLTTVEGAQAPTDPVLNPPLDLSPLVPIKVSSVAFGTTLKKEVEDCHYNFTRLEICHHVPHVSDSCVPHMSVRYQWQIFNFAKL